MHAFADLREARALTAAWLDDYNHHRPHGSLGYQAPASFAAGGGAWNHYLLPNPKLSCRLVQKSGAGHYDAQWIRDYLAADKIEAVISRRGCDSEAAVDFDRERYRGRSVIERLVGRMKEMPLHLLPLRKNCR